ncbi:Methionyl-tRNA formyltransferase [compost metagenome]
MFASSNNVKYIFRNVKSSIIKSNYHIAIGWRWLITVGDSEKLIVIHDSILPKYRGFNPLVTALINGDKQIGATILYGAKDFDMGDIIAQEILNIEYPLSIYEAINKVSELYCLLLNKVLRGISSNSVLEVTSQNPEEGNYSLWRDEEDYHIDWNQDAERINRFIDSVGFPYKGACCYYEGDLIRIIKTSVVPDLNVSNRVPGKLILKKDDMPVIICGSGLLMIEKAKCENGDRVIFKNYRIRLK